MTNKRKQRIPGLGRTNSAAPSPGPLKVVWAPEPPRPRKGPAPGTLDRYGASDRALYAELKQLMRDEHISATAAARQLAENNKVAGVGSPESIARRLAKRYLADSHRPGAGTR